MDTIGELLKQFATLIAAVWSATEVLPRAIKSLQGWGRDQLALVLGPAFGLAATVLDWIALPGDPVGWRLYAGGAFAGFLATVTAGAIHDYLVKPASRVVTKPKP